MDSNEEYLDQLLKSMTDQESVATAARKKDSDPESRLDELLSEFPDQKSMTVQKTFSDVQQSVPEKEMPKEELTSEETRSIEELMQMFSAENSDSSESLGETSGEEKGEEESTSQTDLDAALSMSQDEIERLLTENSSDVQTSEDPHFNMEQEDLSSLLKGLGDEGNEEAREISDLLDKADHDEPVDDAITALLRDVNGDAGLNKAYSEENLFNEEETEKLLDKPAKRKKKERVKKEKKPRKSRKKRELSENSDMVAEDHPSDIEKPAGTEEEIIQEVKTASNSVSTEPQKKSFWSRLLNALTEEEEVNEPTGLISDENDAILQQMEQEELNKARGKKKEKTAGKKDKGKKAAKADGDEAEEDKSRKKKKEKKPKREKKEKTVIAEEKVSGKKLPLKKILPVFLVAIVVTVAYVVISHLYIDYANKQKATAAYYAGDYLECYTLLMGQDLNQSQATMYHKSELKLKMERAKKNYQTLLMENKDLEALDYLVQFLYRYEDYRLEAQEWNCLDVVEETHIGMSGLLTANYGLTEAQALEIAALENDVDYTRALMAVLEGTYGQKEPVEEQPTDVSAYEDLLPEEQEEQDTIFIDTIE